ncbi:MAG: hypothetical protein ACUZ8O_08930 [Candidatus Anammoxibacter sp.]
MTEIDKAIIGIYKLRTPEAFELLEINMILIPNEIKQIKSKPGRLIK